MFTGLAFLYSAYTFLAIHWPVKTPLWCLDDALRDKFVCGLHSEGTQRRLLTVKNLTLQESIETALSMEAAENDSKALQGSKGSNIQQVSEVPVLLDALGMLTIPCSKIDSFKLFENHGLTTFDRRTFYAQKHHRNFPSASSYSS